MANPQLLRCGVCHELPNKVPGFLRAWLVLHAAWVSHETACAVFGRMRGDDQAPYNLRAKLR